MLGSAALRVTDGDRGGEVGDRRRRVGGHGELRVAPVRTAQDELQVHLGQAHSAAIAGGRTHRRRGGDR